MNAAHTDGEATWRALPVHVTLTDSEIARRLADNIEPETPEEYIAYVRYQARRIPDVVVSESINPRDFDKHTTTKLSAIEDRLAGSDVQNGEYGIPKEWAVAVLQDFIQVRKRIEELELLYEKKRDERPAPEAKPPNIADFEAWNTFCFGEPRVLSTEECADLIEAKLQEDISASTHDVAAPVPAPVKRPRPETVVSLTPSKRARTASAGDVDEDAYSSSDEEVVRRTQIALLTKQLEQQKRKILQKAQQSGPFLPWMSTLLAFDQPQTARVIRRLTTAYKRRLALQDALAATTSTASFHRNAAIRGTIASLAERGAGSDDDDDLTGLPEARGGTGPLRAFICPAECSWLYCFLARLDTPLLPEVGAVVRQLFQLCRKQRSILSMRCDAVPETKPYICGLNVLILVAGDFFQQRLAHER